jgi:hypothetical protein
MGILDGHRLRKDLAVVCSARTATSPEMLRAMAMMLRNTQEYSQVVNSKVLACYWEQNT